MGIIEIKGLTKGFVNEKPLFENLSLDIEEGTFVALTGKTDCGKTTLLNIIGGLDHADKGWWKNQRRQAGSRTRFISLSAATEVGWRSSRENRGPTTWPERAR